MVLGFARVFGDMLSNEKGEVRFCWEYSEIDAREICAHFGGRVDYFVAWNSPMAGDPDEGYGLGER